MTSTFTVTCTVNGRRVVEETDVRLSLAEFLRDTLALTGTKVSCDAQVCGACAVLADGEPVSACTYLAADADGRTIATVEGLTSQGRLHRLQEAFIEQMALQCGYCTPGFLVMALALLEANPDPTRAEIIEFLDGNLCRCTGYAPIVEAVGTAARRMRLDRQVGG